MSKEVDRYFVGETEEDFILENREFSILEQDPSKRVKVVDAWAAGGAWIKLRLLDGEWVGKELWFNDCGVGCEWSYSSKEVNDDGFIFNSQDIPGDQIPGLDGLTVTLYTHERFAEFKAEMEEETE